MVKYNTKQRYNYILMIINNRNNGDNNRTIIIITKAIVLIVTNTITNIVPIIMKIIVIKLNDKLKAKIYDQSGFLFAQTSVKKQRNIWKEKQQ